MIISRSTKTSQGGGYIGDIKFTQRTDLEDGLLECDGSEIDLDRASEEYMNLVSKDSAGTKDLLDSTINEKYIGYEDFDLTTLNPEESFSFFDQNYYIDSDNFIRYALLNYQEGLSIAMINNGVKETRGIFGDSSIPGSNIKIIAHRLDKSSRTLIIVAMANSSEINLELNWVQDDQFNLNNSTICIDIRLFMINVVFTDDNYNAIQSISYVKDDSAAVCGNLSSETIDQAYESNIEEKLNFRIELRSSVLNTIDKNSSFIFDIKTDIDIDINDGYGASFSHPNSIGMNFSNNSFSTIIPVYGVTDDSPWYSFTLDYDGDILTNTIYSHSKYENNNTWRSYVNPGSGCCTKNGSMIVLNDNSTLPIFFIINNNIYIINANYTANTLSICNNEGNEINAVDVDANHPFLITDYYGYTGVECFSIHYKDKYYLAYTDDSSTYLWYIKDGDINNLDLNNYKISSKRFETLNNADLDFGDADELWFQNCIVTNLESIPTLPTYTYGHVKVK